MTCRTPSCPAGHKLSRLDLERNAVYRADQRLSHLVMAAEIDNADCGGAVLAVPWVGVGGHLWLFASSVFPLRPLRSLRFKL